LKSIKTKGDHGGKRPGAGRKVSALTTKTRAIAEDLIKSGQSPLEVMLENMRHFQKVALDAETVIESISEDQLGTFGGTPEEQFKALLAKVKQAAGLRQMAHECARDAASYLHPKLTAVTHAGPDGGPVTFKTVYEQRPGS
jgi:hypothetical protein